MLLLVSWYVGDCENGSGDTYGWSAMMESEPLRRKRMSFLLHCVASQGVAWSCRRDEASVKAMK